MKNIKVYCIFIILFISLACTMQNNTAQDVPIGKRFMPSMVVSRIAYPDYKVIQKDTTYVLSLKNNYRQGVSQRIYGILNNSNIFLMQEDIEQKKHNMTKTVHNNLYLMDAKKNILDTLYVLKTNEGEISMSPHVTKDDSLLFLFVNNKDLLIIDINSDAVKKRINNSYEAYGDELNRGDQSDIFSPESKRFVYPILKNNTKKGFNTKSAGLYLYNIESNNNEKILDKEVINPIWSPDGKFIAYIHQGDVYFYYLNSKKEKIFHKTGEDSKVRKLKWHPSGEYIYIQSRKESKRWFHIGPGDGSYLTYQLFDIESGKELDTGGMFHEIGSSFYWR